MTAPEPLKLTTEKAAAELDRICQGPRHGFRMQIPAHPDDSDLVLGEALGALKQLIAERDEAAEPKPIGWDDVTDEDFITALLDCQEQLKQARDDAAELRAALTDWARADRTASEMHNAWLSEAAKGGASYTGNKSISIGQRRWAESLPSFRAWGRASAGRHTAEQRLQELACTALAASEGQS